MFYLIGYGPGALFIECVNTILGYKSHESVPTRGYGNLYDRNDGRRVLLATDQVAPCRALQSLVRLLHQIQLS